MDKTKIPSDAEKVLEIINSDKLDIIVKKYDIFLESGVYINYFRVYFGLFGIVPCSMTISGLNSARFKKWLLEESGCPVLKTFSSQKWGRKNKTWYDNYIYILGNGILVDIDTDGNLCIGYPGGLEKEAQPFVDKAKTLRARPWKPNISNINLIISGGQGVELLTLPLKKPKLDMAKDYNDGFCQLHKSILAQLQAKDKSGLFLFHGLPGTGKSTYIRYLAGCVKKTVIFLPPKLAMNLDEPGLIKILIQNPNSILVIEDGEELIEARENGRGSGISMLLNITDGLLGEAMGIQVICTFNTELQSLDKALLRKGRLLARYQFDKLSIDKAQNLLDGLCQNYRATAPMSHAEIFNLSETAYAEPERKRVGFGG